MIGEGQESRIIDGRFELLDCLGGGGMGLVWRARDNALQRDVALKEVRPPDPGASEADSIGGREMRARVLREARALAQLRHPNVVIIHHIVDSPEHQHPWLVMELVTGGSLAGRLEQGPLGITEAARIGRGVLSALRAAHSVGILHRDIKPGNVLLRPDGSPVLTDFGIAAVRDGTALTVSGSVVGSPEYIAPERIRGHEGNPSSDLWSLGMMLYVAVEGRHPLRRATMLATLAAVLNEQLPPPRYAGALAPALLAILSPDPMQRPDPDTFDRMLATAEHAAEMTMPVGPPIPRIPPPGWAPPTTGRSNPSIGRSNPSIGRSSPSNPLLNRPHPSNPAIPNQQPGPLDPNVWVPQSVDAEPASRPAKRLRRILTALSVVAVLVVGGIVALTLLPGHTGTNPAAGTTPTGAAPAGGGTAGAATRSSAAPAPTSAAAKPPAPPPGDSLTPDGVRATIAAMKPTMGTAVFELDVYPDHASAEAPTAADPKLYDDVHYQNGKTTHEPGGEVDETMGAVDLNAINWDILPGLVAKAHSVLNVPKATEVYLIVDTDFTLGTTGPDIHTPQIRIYLGDAYGVGYLKTDLKGNVIDTYPRS